MSLTWGKLSIVRVFNDEDSKNQVPSEEYRVKSFNVMRQKYIKRMQHAATSTGW